MKKTFKASIVSISLPFSLSAFSKEQARESADIIKANFQNGAQMLSPADMDALLVSEICVYQNFLDYTSEFERIMLLTPDLDSSDIAQVTQLLSLRVNAKKQLDQIKLYSVPDDVARIYSAIETERASGEMPPHPASQGISLGDTKVDLQRQTYSRCANPDFVSKAKPSLSADLLSKTIHYDKPSAASSGPVEVVTGLDGALHFDTSKLHSIQLMVQTTYQNLLLMGLAPR